jgi:hypothetical protein
MGTGLFSDVQLRAMSSTTDQQPLQRIVGRRQSRDGLPLTPDDRARMTQMAQYRTRAPKGVFTYHSHAAMEADRLRWIVEAMVELHRTRQAPIDDKSSG